MIVCIFMSDKNIKLPGEIIITYYYQLNYKIELGNKRSG